MNDNTYIGTVGFSYDAWANGVFYPSNISRAEWLSFYSQQFNSVEIFQSFSKSLEKEVCQSWYQQTPADFKFALRGNQYITHVKRLRGVGEPLKLFMEPLLKLQEKAACLTWEIPHLGRDQTKVLEAFIKHLQKNPHIQNFFEFHPDTILDQKSLLLLSESKIETIAYPPKDSILENHHYLRICPDQGKQNEEWENDFTHKFKGKSQAKPIYIYFTEPQGGLSLKLAKAFKEKINPTP